MIGRAELHIELHNQFQTNPTPQKRVPAFRSLDCALALDPETTTPHSTPSTNTHCRSITLDRFKLEVCSRGHPDTLIWSILLFPCLEGQAGVRNAQKCPCTQPHELHELRG